MISKPRLLLLILIFIEGSGKMAEEKRRHVGIDLGKREYTMAIIINKWSLSPPPGRCALVQPYRVRYVAPRLLVNSVATYLTDMLPKLPTVGNW